MPKSWCERVAHEGHPVEIEAVIAIAKDAAALADSWRRENPLQDGHYPYEEKPDKSKVTGADKALNALIKERLQALTPDIPVVAEESTLQENHAALAKGNGTYWCVDPIDGTSNFVAGRKDWGIFIGLVEHGVPTQGVAYYPDMDQLYYTKNGKALLQEGEQERTLEIKPVPDHGRLRVGGAFKDHHPAFDPTRMRVRSRNELFASQTLPPQHELLVARGEVDVSFRPKLEESQTPAIWDVVAPMAVQRLAGGAMWVHDGHGGDLKEPDFTHPPENLRMLPFMTGRADVLKAYALLGHSQKESGRPGTQPNAR